MVFLITLPKWPECIINICSKSGNVIEPHLKWSGIPFGKTSTTMSKKSEINKG